MCPTLVPQTPTLTLPPTPLLLLLSSPESTNTNDCHDTQTVICDASCEHDNNCNLAEQSDSAFIFHRLQVIVLSMSCPTSLGCDKKRWGTAKVNFELCVSPEILDFTKTFSNQILMPISRMDAKSYCGLHFSF